MRDWLWGGSGRGPTNSRPSSISQRNVSGTFSVSNRISSGLSGRPRRELIFARSTACSAGESCMPSRSWCGVRVTVIDPTESAVGPPGRGSLYCGCQPRPTGTDDEDVAGILTLDGCRHRLLHLLRAHQTRWRFTPQCPGDVCEHVLDLAQHELG